MRPGTLSVSGGSLETAWWGPEPQDAPAIVLLHEGLGSVSQWREVPHELAVRTGLPVLVYSRYGSGRSQVLGEKRTPRYMHDEALIVLPELLERCNISESILVGHSDGASIALIYAAAHADRVRGIVLEAPHSFVEALSVQSITAARAAYKSTDLRARLARHHADVDRTFYGWNDIWLNPAFRDWNLESHVRALEGPVLLIQGRDDEYGTTAQVKSIERYATRARIDALVLASCGHAPHRDRAAATISAIASFIGEL